MRYIQGDDRYQITLLPRVIDDYVSTNAPVRVIDAFVDSLDFGALGFERASPACVGRPGYDPRDMLRLYIYGYLNEIRSSRRLERECGRNLELMWLLRGLAPDFKTIADFRRDNGKGIIGACHAFVLFCKEQGLFNAQLVAIDGSKFRAAASARRLYDRQALGDEREKLDERIAYYLSRLDDEDESEASEHARVGAALAALEERKAKLKTLAAQLETSERTYIVEGEPDARPMGAGRGKKPPSYNVQTVVDADAGLILHHDVTDEATDSRLLYVMAKAAKDALVIERLKVVADTGYASGMAAAACEANHITACVPVNRSLNNQGDGKLFDRTAFTYDAHQDRFVCPSGHPMPRKQTMNARAQIVYHAREEHCSTCALKPKCTTARRRIVTRHLKEDALERMNARCVEDPSLMFRRRCSVEHPFGTIKRMTAGGRFLTRNLKGTRTEMALSVIAYNMKRSFNLKSARN